MNRQYIKQDKQNLLMTELGTFLIETVLTIPVLAKFISIGTTTQWEQQLHDSPNQFLDSIKNFIKTDFLNITIEREWKEPDKQSLGVCPVCGKGKIIEGKSRFYCSDYKTTGCKFSIWKEICGAKITAADAQLLLSGKATRSKKFTSKKGTTFSAKLKCLNKKIEFVFENKK